MDNETRTERLRQFLEKRRRQVDGGEPPAAGADRRGPGGGLGGGFGRWRRQRGAMGGGRGAWWLNRERPGWGRDPSDDDIIPATPAQIAREKQRLRIREGWLEKQLAITRKRLEDIEALEAYALETGILDDPETEDPNHTPPAER